MLFLNVDSAKKRGIDKAIIKLLGEDPDDEPKRGRYTACCTSEPMAELILEMLKNGEHLGEVSYDQVHRFRVQLPFDPSPIKFHEYRDHDYRRLNITLQTLDLAIDGSIEICCNFHGQSSYQTFKRYFQWGLAARRKQSYDPKVQLKIFTKKPKLP